METKVETITPQRALDILQNNAKNRNLDKSLVMHFANQMKDGGWRLTGQGISLADDGTLIDGQHRLAAIVKCRQPQKFIVTYGLNYNEVYPVYDTGKVRTAKDVLSINNVKYAGPIGSAIRLKLALDKNVSSYYNALKSTNTEILNEYGKHRDKYDIYIRLSTSYYNKLKILTKPTLCGILCHLDTKKHNDPTKIKCFFDQLYGVESVTNYTIEILRSVLVNNLAQRERMNINTKLRYIAKVWNAYITNDNYRKLVLRDSDKKVFL